jgi:integrator complex subunit 11
MITGGFSLEAFKKWAPSEKNLVTLPGYILYLSCFSIFQSFKLLACRQALPNLLLHNYSDATFLFFPHRYCVSGTIGHKLMCGKPTRVDYEDTHIDVRCQVDFHLISYLAKNVQL